MAVYVMRNAHWLETALLYIKNAANRHMALTLAEALERERGDFINIA